MSVTAIGIIGIIILVTMFFTQMPVAFVMALVGFLGFSHLVAVDASLSLLAKDFFQIFSSYNLTVVPLFIFMGQIAFHSGIGRSDAAYKFMGRMPGGLAMATIGACAGFSAICGSTIATATTMAAVSLPEMKRYGYDSKLATGSVAAGGSLGILIPPSTIFIVYGIMTEQSIGSLFAAGIFPGILLAGLFIATIYIAVSFNPSLASRGPKVGLKQKLIGLLGILEMLAIFILVMGGLFMGFFTPTEAAAVGAFAILALSVFRKQLTRRRLLQALVETTRINCMVMVIIAGATVFGHFIAITRIPFNLAEWVGGLPLPVWAILVLIMFVYLLGGMFMDGLAFLLLTVPIFYPVVMKLGYNPIWFGVIIVLLTEMAAITPPVGINVYSVSGVATDVPLETIFRGVLIFIFPLAICIIILIWFPQIALFLPSHIAQ
jgi:tripartite ATP-independent transporter DctM subunit